ncbi:acyltransferase family protein [Frankia sp. AgKG'84/4]
MVVVVHSSFPAGITLQSPVGPYFARAEAGVAVFFLISGFLLYRPFVAARLNGTSGAPGAGYLVRRFLRIFPLYWLALAVTLNVVSDDRVGVHGIAGVFQTGLLVQGYHAGWALQGLTQAWTLDIEVAFYLAVPVYAWLMGRRCRSAESQVRVELAALAVTFLASKLVHYLVIPRRSGLLSGWGVWLPVWWDLFAIGMALAVLSARYAQLDRQPRWASLPGSGTACWALAAFFYWVSAKHADLPLSPIFVPNRLQDMNRHLYYGLFALFLLLPAVFGRQDRGIVRPLLACRPMVFLGTISYGIYLWHTTMIDLVLQHSGWTLWKIQYGPFLAIVLGLTIVAATITNRLVERPAIRLSHGWARQLDAWVARRRRGRSEPAAPAAVLSRAGTVPAATVPASTVPASTVPASTVPASTVPGAAAGRGGPPADTPTVPLPSRSAGSVTRTADWGRAAGRLADPIESAPNMGRPVPDDAEHGWVPRAWQRPPVAGGAQSPRADSARATRSRPGPGVGPGGPAVEGVTEADRPSSGEHHTAG